MGLLLAATSLAAAICPTAELRALMSGRRLSGEICEVGSYLACGDQSQASRLGLTDIQIKGVRLLHYSP